VKRTLAALIESGHIIGCTTTSAQTGDVVCYGSAIDDGKAIHQYGRATVTRARKPMQTVLRSTWIPHYDVNYGGGAPI
jgi:hypothetical protein